MGAVNIVLGPTNKKNQAGKFKICSSLWPVELAIRRAEIKFRAVKRMNRKDIVSQLAHNVVTTFI